MCTNYTSLFSKGPDVNESFKELNLDLEKTSQWVFQCKMQFSPDPNKQANRSRIFSKIKSSFLSLVYFQQ